MAVLISQLGVDVNLQALKKRLEAIEADEEAEREEQSAELARAMTDGEARENGRTTGGQELDVPGTTVV